MPYKRSEFIGKQLRISERDLRIAAQALRLKAVLVTRNGREFGRVRGLTVENWESPTAQGEDGHPGLGV